MKLLEWSYVISSFVCLCVLVYVTYEISLTLENMNKIKLIKELYLIDLK